MRSQDRGSVGALSGFAPLGLGAVPLGGAIGGGVDLATVLTVVQATGAQLSGTIQSYSDPPGWGFLECPALGLQPGKGIFFHVKECNGLGPNPEKGAPVTFTVNNGPSGRLQASNVQPGSATGQMQQMTPEQQLQKQQRVIQQQQQQLQMLQQQAVDSGGGLKRFSTDVIGAPTKSARRF